MSSLNASGLREALDAFESTADANETGYIQLQRLVDFVRAESSTASVGAQLFESLLQVKESVSDACQDPLPNELKTLYVLPSDMTLDGHSERVQSQTGGRTVALSDILAGIFLQHRKDIGGPSVDDASAYISFFHAPISSFRDLCEQHQHGAFTVEPLVVQYLQQRLTRVGVVLSFFELAHDYADVREFVNKTFFSPSTGGTVPPIIVNFCSLLRSLYGVQRLRRRYEHSIHLNVLLLKLLLTLVELWLQTVPAVDRPSSASPNNPFVLLAETALDYAWSLRDGSEIAGGTDSPDDPELLDYMSSWTIPVFLLVIAADRSAQASTRLALTTHNLLPLLDLHLSLINGMKRPASLQTCVDDDVRWCESDDGVRPLPLLDMLFVEPQYCLTLRSFVPHFRRFVQHLVDNFLLEKSVGYPRFVKQLCKSFEHLRDDTDDSPLAREIDKRMKSRQLAVVELLHVLAHAKVSEPLNMRGTLHFRLWNSHGGDSPHDLLKAAVLEYHVSDPAAWKVLTGQHHENEFWYLPEHFAELSVDLMSRLLDFVAAINVQTQSSALIYQPDFSSTWDYMTAALVFLTTYFSHRQQWQPDSEQIVSCLRLRVPPQFMGSVYSFLAEYMCFLADKDVAKYFSLSSTILSLLTSESLSHAVGDERQRGEFPETIGLLRLVRVLPEDLVFRDAVEGSLFRFVWLTIADILAVRGNVSTMEWFRFLKLFLDFMLRYLDKPMKPENCYLYQLLFRQSPMPIQGAIIIRFIQDQGHSAIRLMGPQRFYAGDWLRDDLSLALESALHILAEALRLDACNVSLSETSSLNNQGPRLSSRPIAELLRYFEVAAEDRPFVTVDGLSMPFVECVALLSDCVYATEVLYYLSYDPSAGVVARINASPRKKLIVRNLVASLELIARDHVENVQNPVAKRRQESFLVLLNNRPFSDLLKDLYVDIVRYAPRFPLALTLLHSYVTLEGPSADVSFVLHSQVMEPFATGNFTESLTYLSRVDIDLDDVAAISRNVQIVAMTLSIAARGFFSDPRQREILRERFWEPVCKSGLLRLVANVFAQHATELSKIPIGFDFVVESSRLSQFEVPDRVFGVSVLDASMLFSAFLQQNVQEVDVSVLRSTVDSFCHKYAELKVLCYACHLLCEAVSMSIFSVTSQTHDYLRLLGMDNLPTSEVMCWREIVVLFIDLLPHMPSLFFDCQKHIASALMWIIVPLSGDLDIRLLLPSLFSCVSSLSTVAAYRVPSLDARTVLLSTVLSVLCDKLSIPYSSVPSSLLGYLSSLTVERAQLTPPVGSEELEEVTMLIRQHFRPWSQLLFTDVSSGHPLSSRVALSILALLLSSSSSDCEETVSRLLDFVGSTARDTSPESTQLVSIAMDVFLSSASSLPLWCFDRLCSIPRNRAFFSLLLRIAYAMPGCGAAVIFVRHFDDAIARNLSALREQLVDRRNCNFRKDLMFIASILSRSHCDTTYDVVRDTLLLFSQSAAEQNPSNAWSSMMELPDFPMLVTVSGLLSSLNHSVSWNNVDAVIGDRLWELSSLASWASIRLSALSILRQRFAASCATMSDASQLRKYVAIDLDQMPLWNVDLAFGGSDRQHSIAETVLLYETELASCLHNVVVLFTHLCRTVRPVGAGWMITPRDRLRIIECIAEVASACRQTEQVSDNAFLSFLLHELHL